MAKAKATAASAPKRTSKTAPKPERCLVGVGVMIVNNGRVLVGVRQGSHCAGELSFPGGHVDLTDQSLEECCSREVAEEILDPRTGAGFAVKVEPMGAGGPQVFLRHDLMEGGTKAYVTLFIKAVPEDHTGLSDLASMPSPPEESHKCERWDWMEFPELVERVVGKADWTWSDLVGQPQTQKAWIPLDFMMLNLNRLGLSILRHRRS